MFEKLRIDSFFDMINGSFKRHEIQKLNEQFVMFFNKMLDCIRLAAFITNNEEPLKIIRPKLGEAKIYFSYRGMVTLPFFEALKNILPRIFPVYVEYYHSIDAFNKMICFYIYLTVIREINTGSDDFIA